MNNPVESQALADKLCGKKQGKKQRADLILAIACLRGEESFSRLAYRLADDPGLSARALAEDLELLDDRTRELLSRRALEAEQVSFIPEKGA